MKQPLYQHLAQILDARDRCNRAAAEPRNSDWRDRHTQALEYIARELLPSGSGVDDGTSIDLDRSRPDRIVLQTSYHHMTENGLYDGWTDHTITIRPSLAYGFDLKISGRDRNDIKDYLGELYEHILSTPIESDRAWYGLQDETTPAPEVQS